MGGRLTPPFPAVIHCKDPWTSLRLNVEHGHRVHFHGSCAMPVEIHLTSNFVSWDRSMIQRFTNLITARCRKCEPCRKAFYWHWHQRTMLEIARATRSLLVTLTFETAPDTLKVYSEARNYLRRLRLWADRHGYEGTKLRMLFVIQRGDRGTRRLHIHMLLCEIGVPLPDDVYNNPLRADKDGNPYVNGQWYGGHADVRPITRDPARAAGYVLRYCLRDAIGKRRVTDDERDRCETLPGGRRLSASTFWGPGKPQHPRAAFTGNVYTARQWVTDLVKPHTNMACDDPLAPGRGEQELTASPPTNCPSCALAIKSQEHPEPRGPPLTTVKDWLEAIKAAFAPSNTHPMAIFDHEK